MNEWGTNRGEEGAVSPLSCPRKRRYIMRKKVKSNTKGSCTPGATPRNGRPGDQKGRGLGTGWHKGIFSN